MSNEFSSDGKSGAPDGALGVQPRLLADPVEHAGVVVTGHDFALGAVLLRLICDWDSWIERRVDSFSFAGDDERVLERHQSVDLVLPHELITLQSSLNRDASAIPVPITLVNKWRLPQFSLRDEHGGVVSLLARDESTPLSAAMLLTLGDFILGGVRGPGPVAMPAELQSTIVQIAAAEPVESLALCVGLADKTDKISKTLAGSEVFMSLAYELARGFPLIALMPINAQRRRVIKFSYASYVVPARPDPRLVQLRHVGRLLRNRSWDLTETSGWRKRIDPPQPLQAELVVSVEGDYITERLRERERAGGIACVLVTVKGARGRSRTLRLQPNAAARLHGLPPGTYSVKLTGVSGFRVKGLKEDTLTLKAGRYDYHVATEREDPTKRVTQAAPRIAGRAWAGLRLSRALSLNNKPLAIRVRVGHGGSYHCEFVAPDGLHVTRARLISDVGTELPGEGEGTSRSHEIDLVLDSKQRAHLYAPARSAKPAAAYAYLHLRPRVETIGRSALLTAIISTFVLGFIARTWDGSEGYVLHGPEDSSALLVLVLGAPSALAAYFAQGITSRVTTSVLSGLRFAALVPSLLLLAAGGVMLVGEGRAHGHSALWVLFIVALLVTAMLAASAWLAEHPREQARWNQGPGFKEWYTRRLRPQVTADVFDDGSVDDGPVEPVIIRGRMLERAGGMDQETRRTALAQHTFLRTGWRAEVSPSLYFDSAETPPTFRGLGRPETLESLVKQVSALVTANPIA